MTQQKEIVLSVKRPIIRNAVTALISGTLIAASIYPFCLVIGAAPESFNEKLLISVGFTLLWVLMLFSSGFFIDSIRNILSKPTIVLTNDTIQIQGHELLMLSDIASAETVGKDKRLKITLNSGEEITVKQSALNIPTQTVLYAVKLRRAESEPLA